MTTAPQKHWFGLFGTLFGCLAILAAVLPLWVLPLVQPPEPIDKVVVDVAQRIKDRVAAKVQKVEYKEPATRANLSKVLSAVAVSLGALALVCAAVSFVVKEPRRFAAAAAALGVGAILFQFSLIIASALLAILLVMVVLNALGISL
ncbi:hypothetical protein [Comamonas sp. BIGb0124]|uniref:hypothetical protein n=1 Tax=Comamonas sp. BIGb0124 TaxID=2485130 RepID=UPI0011CE126A|nr:hypothetical protein [Comamonas sp. BIGb0124]